METENDNTIQIQKDASLQVFTENLRTLISTGVIAHTTLIQLNAVLSRAYTICCDFDEKENKAFGLFVVEDWYGLWLQNDRQYPL